MSNPNQSNLQEAIETLSVANAALLQAAPVSDFEAILLMCANQIQTAIMILERSLDVTEFEQGKSNNNK